MFPLFQLHYDANGDIYATPGRVYQPSSGRARVTPIPTGCPTFQGTNVFPRFTNLIQAGGNPDLPLIGGSGRNLIVNPGGGGFANWDDIPRVLAPSAADEWTAAGFVLEKTGASTASLNMPGAGAIAEMTTGTAPAGTYASTTLGQDNYNGGLPFTLEVTLETDAPGAIPEGIITVSAGTFPTSGSLAAVDEWNWNLPSDLLVTLETFWDGSAALSYDGDIIATREVGYNPRSPAGLYTANAQGETDFNGGDPWTAVIESAAIPPLAGDIYVDVIYGAGLLSEVRGPYHGTKPAPAVDHLYIPIARSDGLGTVNQYHTGLLLVPAATVPVITVAPAITGDAFVGMTLSCDTGTWTADPTAYSYQWCYDDSGWLPIPGATAATYEIEADYLGFQLACFVTARTASWSGAAAQSNATAAVTELSLLTNLLAHWKLDETTGTRVDSHGTFDLTDSGSTPYVTGVLGNAADFDGSTYLSSTGNPLGTGATALTLAAWLKPTEATGWMELIGSWSGGYRYMIAVLNNTAKGGIFTELNETFLTGPDICTDAAWHLVAIVYEAGTFKLYVDGTLEDTATGVGDAVADGTADFRIADQGGNEPCVSSVDSVSIWNRALSGTEITTLYNSGAGLDYEDFT